MKIAVSTILVLAAAVLVQEANAQCNPSRTIASGRYAPGGQLCQGQMIFNEEFNSLNMDLWEHENSFTGGYNGEFQWYTNNRRNTFVSNGALVIRPTLTTDVVPNLTNCQIHLDK